MAAWKLAPAIAAGDCIVFKPSSETSLSMLVFTELIQDLLPAGVLNLITGSGSNQVSTFSSIRDLASLLSPDPQRFGRDIAVAAAERLIPATLELGGKVLTSSLTTVTGMQPSMAYSLVFSLIRDRYAVPDPASSYTNRFTTGLSQSL